MRGLSVKNHAALVGYVREIAAVLGLSHWSLRLPADEYAEDGTHAHCESIEGRHYSTIRFARNFLESDDAEVRYVVTHELLHCHTADLSDCVSHDLRAVRSMSRSELRLFRAGFARREEYLVDALASVIAPMLPLPKWGMT